MSSITKKISKSVATKQLGNFVITKQGKGRIKRMNVSTTDGSWTLSVREDSKLYYLLDQAKDGDMNDNVLPILLNAFVISNCVDAEFQGEILCHMKKMMDESEKS